MVKAEDDEEVLRHAYGQYAFPNSQPRTFADGVYAEMMAEIIKDKLSTLTLTLPPPHFE